jgi:hypothetical protein
MVVMVAQGSESGTPMLRVWLLRLAPLWCALAFIALQATAVHHDIAAADSYQYGFKTLKLLGLSNQEAHKQATTMVCRRTAWAQERARELDPWQRYHGSAPTLDTRVSDCVNANPTYVDSNPRYSAIFDSRPGFPLLSVPAVKILGLERGMMLTSLILGAAGGAVIFLLMTLARVPRGPALLAQVLYYALPTGYWGSRILTEGPMLLTTVAVLIGAWLLVQRRIGAGLILTFVATGVSFAVRYAQVPLLGITLTAAAVGIWLFDRERRHAGTIALAIVSLGAIAVGLVLPRLLGWPGFDESLQDTFTNHFTKGPDVADPTHRLIALNASYWKHWLQEQVLHPLLLLAVAGGGLALWRWSRSFALIVLAAAATGIASDVAHPVWNQADRLYVQLWLAAIFGLPLFWPLLGNRVGGAGQREHSASGGTGLPAAAAGVDSEPEPVSTGA